MNNSILKINWERSHAYTKFPLRLLSTVILPYTKETIKEISLLSNGCGNTNYKVTLTSGMMLLLRIYVRDRDALQRERNLYTLLQGRIPVPKMLYIDDSFKLINYPVAIIEWIDGMLMREAIISNTKLAISQTAYEAGIIIAILRQIKFKRGGFFKTDLKIQPFSDEESYLPLVMKFLEDKGIKSSLGLELTQSIKKLIDQNLSLIPNKAEVNLTHGDFDPSNIIVNLQGGQWKVAGVLDWEFAHAGTYSSDIGTFIRYSHKCPDSYEVKFIEGIQSTETVLPASWKKSAKLMDLLNLLQLLYTNNEQKRPFLMSDVTSLINHTVTSWDTF